MNCFEWHSRVSDYLDGTMIGPAKRAADAHVETCETCEQRYKHYRVILTSIASQPRSSLPVPIRKAPLTAALPRLDLARFSRSRWEQVPWYIRTTLEGVSIVLIILIGISSGPKLRALYERNIEKRLGEFNDTLSVNDASDGPSATDIPLLRGKPNADSLSGSAGAGSAAGQLAAEGNKPHDEFSGGEAGETESDDPEETSDATEEAGSENLAVDGETRVGPSEIWRFNLKTDSPHEFRPKVVQILRDLKVPSETPGFGGIEAPGGIQFDLLVARTAVAGLKKNLMKVAPPAPEGIALNNPVRETFTWFKNKSKNKLPEGKTRVVIWLSQM